MQCSSATEVWELYTARGGAKWYGVYIGEVMFPIANSEFEAARRLDVYR